MSNTETSGPFGTTFNNNIFSGVIRKIRFVKFVSLVMMTVMIDDDD